MSVPALSQRDAIRLAWDLGWTVEEKRRTGELRFRAPDGRRFCSQMPGRKKKTVPVKLTVALYRAAGRM